MDVTIVIIAAIVVAIALGFAFNINIGLFAIAFSYIIGAFLMGLKTKDIILMWPTNLFWMIMAITFFYGFAISNGTLALIARKAVFATRNHPYLIPIVLFLLTAFISGIGPGAIAVFALLSPLVMSILLQSNINPILGAVILLCGGSAGGWSPVAVNGVVTKGLIEKAGYAANASAYGAQVWGNMVIVTTIIFVIAYFVLAAYKTKEIAMEAPPSFNRDQRITVGLTGAVLLAAVLPSVLAAVFPGSRIMALVKNQIDITFVAMIAAMIAMFCRIGSEKDVISKIPWGVIILICGTGMLIEVAVKAGTMEVLSNWVGRNVSASGAPVLIALVAGIMSFFASTLGVVIPALYPIVPGIASATGADPGVMFSAIACASAMMGHSPFSTGGALAVAAVTDEVQRRRVFKALLAIPFLTLLLNVVLVALGMIH